MPFENGQAPELRAFSKPISAELLMNDVEQMTKVLLRIHLREAKPHTVYEAR